MKDNGERVCESMTVLSLIDCQWDLKECKTDQSPKKEGNCKQTNKKWKHKHSHSLNICNK